MLASEGSKMPPLYELGSVTRTNVCCRMNMWNTRQRHPSNLLIQQLRSLAAFLAAFLSIRAHKRHIEPTHRLRSPPAVFHCTAVGLTSPLLQRMADAATLVTSPRSYRRTNCQDASSLHRWPAGLSSKKQGQAEQQPSIQNLVCL